MKTRLNLNPGILADIESAAGKLNISRSILIKRLVKCFEVDTRTNITLNRNVQYQKNEDADEWKQFHLYLSEAEYERFIDMRKFYKMSFSLIVAVCVKKYLKSLLDKKTNRNPNLPNNGDNYPFILFPAYCLLYQKKDSGHKFTVYWGLPDKLPENF